MNGEIRVVYLISKVLAWEICYMKQEFAKKFIIKSYWQFEVTLIFTESHVMYCQSIKTGRRYICDIQALVLRSVVQIILYLSYS